MLRVRRGVLRAVLSAALLIAAGCGSDEGEERSAVRPIPTDSGPQHVHGLGINPKDGALIVATHTGLFRAATGEQGASRIGDRFQDTMGFTVVGADRFLGSGHPDLRDKLPPFLGLIRSDDGGRSWSPVSLSGKADFHVLEAQGRYVYGFGSDWDTRSEQFLVSRDGGKRWRRRSTPEPLVALAIRPGRPETIIAAGEQGLYSSEDGGASWRPVDGPPGLLAWPAADRLYVLGADGTVRVSADAGRSWRTRGNAGGEPAAFEAAGPGDLYAALHEGPINRSTDAGSTWRVRVRP